MDKLTIVVQEQAKTGRSSNQTPSRSPTYDTKEDYQRIRKTSPGFFRTGRPLPPKTQQILVVAVKDLAQIVS